MKTLISVFICDEGESQVFVCKVNLTVYETATVEELRDRLIKDLKTEVELTIHGVYSRAEVESLIYETGFSKSTNNFIESQERFTKHGTLFLS